MKIRFELFLTAFFCLLAVPPRDLAAAVPPSDIVLNSASVREGQAAGTVVGILKAMDPDPSDPHSFTLVAGEGDQDNALFATSGDTLRTAAVLSYTNQNRFSIRVRTQDGSGYNFEKPFAIMVTPPSFMTGFGEYFATNAEVWNASLATFDQPTVDYFWVYQNCLAERGTIEMEAPANTPAETATNGTGSVYLSSTEATRIHAAKAAHAVWLDKNARVPWRLRDYAPEHLRGLFAKTNLFNPQSTSVFYFLSVVDHSPTEAYQYARQNGRIRGTVFETIQAVLDDFRCDFLHGSSGYGDPACAYTLRMALGTYSTNRWRPARITRSGCHSMSRILLGVLRSVNIPGYETASGAYYLSGHSEAVFPCVGQVLPHGDDLYSADLTATPVEELMPTLQFFLDNLNTPPCAGNTYRVAKRYQAQRGTLYPTPTMLSGVRNPASYGYTNAVEFLTRYAGWDQGLTGEELQQAADTLLAQYNETRRLTVLTATAQGYVINNPVATDYVKESRVLLKALPKAGYVFSRWTGDVPGGQETANPLVVRMDADKSIQATFTRPPATVSIGKAPTGEVLIWFAAMADVAYTVEYRGALGAGIWQTLTNVAAQPTTAVVTNSDTALQTQAQRFYRIVSR